tara:strand:+ start:331 stop:540 length:210 start_codon:yes stop_codon:yes gene_type:complete
MKTASLLTHGEVVERSLQDADEALEDVKDDLNTLIDDIEVLRLKIASMALRRQIDETGIDSPIYRMTPR